MLIYYKKMSNKIMCGSFDEHKGYYISQVCDKKNYLQVKIITNATNESSDQLEDKINAILLEFNGKFDIVDIKYAETSCMIIYKKL
jgi:hypothetical protein